MKKILFFSLLISLKMYGQSVTIVPTNVPTSEFLKIKKDGIGLDHRSANNLIGLGTHNDGSIAKIQTHTNHALGFATNGIAAQMVLKTNGNFGIGTSEPQYKLDITQRARIRSSTNTAGIWFSKSTNNNEEGAFFGNINDTQTGIWIGNAWRFGLNESGVVNVPNLGGVGTRSLGADANGNIVALPTQSTNSVAFAATRFPNTSYTIPNGIYTMINFTGEEYDISNNYDGFGVFTAPSAGVYYFVINLSWEPNANGVRVIDIRKNNESLKIDQINSNSASNILPQKYTTSMYLNQNDQITLWMYQNSGSGLDLWAGLVRDPIVFSGYKVN